MNSVRFMQYIKKADSGCWLWQGATINKGYGKCGHNYKTVLAHRMAYILFVGPIGDKMVLHKCDVRLCVNPAHLFLGTNTENMQDAKAKGVKLGGPIVIPDEKIFEVYKLRSKLLSEREIALALALDRGYVSAVLTGNIRKDLLELWQQENGTLVKFHSGQKFSVEDRTEMIRLYHEGKLSSTQIAVMFNTTYKYVWKLANQKVV